MPLEILPSKKAKGEFITFLDVDDWWNEKFLSSRKKFYSSNKKYAFAFSNCLHYYENLKKFESFYYKKLPSGYILDQLLKYYFVKLSTIILKRELLKNFKFNPNYNIIGDYDLIIRLSRKFKGMGFQDKLVNIRIHRHNFTHNNRIMFYREFKHWMNNQNFNDYSFKKNKNFLSLKLEYLRLIYLLMDNKNFGLLVDIFKFPKFHLKLKLLTIFFTPGFLVRLKKDYF